MEHTMHDPPTSNFYVTNEEEKWTMDGWLQHTADVGANKLEIMYKGPVNISLKNRSF